ncbi:lytic transglycosylase domain-containing protein [Aquidulcibacter sp.]|uniref:lytic transglycosylase domain-containing protein n=1 Tax=Aquidulcibacter sp. TaxID=2052990 RepID=UPI0025C57F31|nr:lytic transglycosylase domain-containing protein [Aquidulcibacter sp.]MCA3694791.1 lytic transglycosylase domain-containing protein [Aquidulcibacter sp.]
MVGRTVILIMSLLATPALADPPDWTQAGGSLFIEPGLRPEQKPAESTNPTIKPDQTQADPMPNYGAVRLLPARQPLDTLITQIANETGLDPKLLHALVIVESAYDVRAVSPVGARGLTQLMPATARELGVANTFDGEENLRGGARYLAAQIGRFGDLRLALAAYNAGPNRVARLGRVPEFLETQNYVRDAVDCYLALTAGRGIRHRNQCRATGRR